MELVLNKEQIKDIIIENCKRVFNESVLIYLEVIDINLLTVEVHFSDNNFYEVDAFPNMTLKALKMKIQECLIEERLIDLKYPNVNRNNVRFFRN